MYVLDSNNNLITIVRELDWELKSIYSGLTIEELKSQYWELKILNSDEAIKIINESDNKKYNVWTWRESTIEEFTEMFEILPPEKYTNQNNFEIFRMCEYLTWDITSHFLKINNKYYVWNFRTWSYNNRCRSYIKGNTFN